MRSIRYLHCTCCIIIYILLCVYYCNTAGAVGNDGWVELFTSNADDGL